MPPETAIDIHLREAAEPTNDEPVIASAWGSDFTTGYYLYCCGLRGWPGGWDFETYWNWLKRQDGRLVETARQGQEVMV